MRRSTIDEVNARIKDVTVPRRFLELAAERPDVPLLHSRNHDGSWNAWTPADVCRLAAETAQGLLVDRVPVGERVLLMMRNRHTSAGVHTLQLPSRLRECNKGTSGRSAASSRKRRGTVTSLMRALTSSIVDRLIDPSLAR